MNLCCAVCGKPPLDDYGVKKGDVCGRWFGGRGDLWQCSGRYREVSSSSAETDPTTIEQKAMIGDKLATLRIVSALRKYRAAAKTLLAKRYRDGENDACALTEFQDACADAEKDLVEDDDA